MIATGSDANSGTEAKPLDGVAAHRQSIHSHGEDAALVRADDVVALKGHIPVDQRIRGIGKALEPGDCAQGSYLFGHRSSLQGGVTDRRLTDCLIEHIGAGATFGGGIRISYGSDRNQVLNNVVRDTGRGGIFGDHSAELVVRNNQVSGSGGEGLGIELWGGCPRSLIVVVTDNLVRHGAAIGLSVSNKSKKNNVYWGYNTISDCAQWGAQF